MQNAQTIPFDDLGFIVLCPERNWGGLKNTARSIRENFPKSPSLCVVGDNATKAEIREFNSEIKTYVGGKTITSLINKGMNETKRPWNFIGISGRPVRYGALKKYFHFVDSYKDILFPVIDWKWLFHEGSIHALLIHKNCFHEIGDMIDDKENLTQIKLVWAATAIEKGVRFKGIVGLCI